MDQASQDRKIPDEPSSTAPGGQLISADAAAKALRDLFLANAERGDNAANDGLVDALVRRIRAQQALNDGDGSHQGSRAD
ncbi:MAG TPA: hypothetical protein VIY28_14410 [Pseudonocardiaceae bacterium]